MAAGQTRLVSLLKKVWDNEWKKTNKVMLILCCSVASFMIRKVIHSSALYGRIDCELALAPLLPEEAKQLIGSGRAIEEIFKYILVLGGIPRYLEMIQANQSFDQNMKKLFFSKNAIMLQEYEKIFYSQFREPRTYEKIINFWERSPSFLDDIAKHLAMASSGGIKVYLDNLERASFITSYFPYDRSANSKLKKYKLTDEFLRFYLKFILPNKNLIVSQEKNLHLYDKLIKEHWQPWLGFAFENFCLKNAMFLAKKMGFADQVKGYGSHFSRNPTGLQIDLVFERFDQTITVCELKYHNKEIPPSIIVQMEQKISKLQIPKGYTVEKALVSQYGSDKMLRASGYFHHDISINQMFS